MTPIFPDGSKLMIKPIGGGEFIEVIGFDSIGGKLSADGTLKTDTVLSDTAVKYAAGIKKDGGERTIIARLDETGADPGHAECALAATDGLERELQIKIGQSGKHVPFKAVFVKFDTGLSSSLVLFTLSKPIKDLSKVVLPTPFLPIRQIISP